MFVLKNGNEAHQDGDGNWVQPDAAEPEMVSICREETNGRGNEIQVGNGVFFKYSSLIQMPKGVKQILEGSTVFVSNDQAGSDVRIKGTVLKFDSGQLHCRMWLN